MAAAAGAGLGIMGALGSAASDAMASDVNAKQLDAKARSIDQQTDFDVMQQRRESRLFLGEQNANAAASGVTITSGSPYSRNWTT